MSTQIKRLKLQGKEFVPITLAEAVVVKTDKLPILKDSNIPDITTLDRVLAAVLGIDVQTYEGVLQLNEAVNTINAALANKQDKLTPGNNITIDSNGVISCTYSLELYEVLTSMSDLPQPSAKFTNKIYLVPNPDSDVSGNYLNEYVCVKTPLGGYTWEMLGTIQTETDLSGYVTKTEFQQFAITSVQAEDVKTSAAAGNVAVLVVYDIPATLYDSVIVSDSSSANGDWIG